MLVPLYFQVLVHCPANDSFPIVPGRRQRALEVDTISVPDLFALKNILQALEYPIGFRAFAAIPFPFIEESMTEIQYALDQLKLDGVCLYPIVGEKQLDNEDCLPILEELEIRKTVVLPHPLNSEGIPVDNEQYLDAVLCFTRLMYFDRLKLCHNVRFILAHTGGVIPFLADNIGLLQYLQDNKKRIGKFLWDYLFKKRLAGDVIMKYLYIDTSDCFDESSFQSQNRFFHSGHLLWGSDSACVTKNIENLNKHKHIFQNPEPDFFS